MKNLALILFVATLFIWFAVALYWTGTSAPKPRESDSIPSAITIQPTSTPPITSAPTATPSVSLLATPTATSSSTVDSLTPTKVLELKY